MMQIRNDAELVVAEQKQSSLGKVIGPGLLFAGSAVGVSHLVQSTRAGALYGLGLVIFILLAFIVKYPSFVFAPRYTAATGKSVLSSYRQQGVFALSFYALSSLLTMFIGTAANLLVTAGLVKAVLGIDAGILPISLLLSALGVGLLVLGHYHWLDRIMKVLIAFLTLATLAAAVVALPMINWDVSGSWQPSRYDLATFLFIAALVGWMPTPSDVSVWQSQWIVAKIRDTGYLPNQRETKLDFHVGYFATLVLALCFVILGAAVMHGSGQSFEGSPGKFAAQVIGLYENALGAWSGAAVGMAALAVMFSTFLTILDGFPRGLANFLLMLKGQEEGASTNPRVEALRHRFYWCLMLAVVVGSLLILSFFLGSLKQMVDFAATISFMAAPVFAYLNHRAILGAEVPETAKPGAVLRWWSYIGMTLLGGFAMAYIYLVFIH